jgi:hypothetical protein
MDFKEIECGSVEFIHLVHDSAKMVGSCKHSKELPGYIKSVECLNQPNNYQLLKDCTP